MADASHELQTPLTAIRAAAELLIENPDIEEPQKEKILRRIVEQQERISALVERPPSSLAVGIAPADGENERNRPRFHTVAFLAKEYASHPLASHIKTNALSLLHTAKRAHEELRRA